MGKKTAGLLGAVAGLATMGSAQAARPVPHVAEALQVSSYSDLLAPIPDAVAVLKANDLARAQVRDVNGYVYFNYGPPLPPPPYAYERPPPFPGYGPYYPRYYPHHHHHHNHHHHHHHR